MAAQPEARQIWARWEYDGKKGGLQISVGALQYLGLKRSDIAIGETDVKYAGTTYKRRLYPNGPEITCTMGTTPGKRIMGGLVSTAKSGDTMYLEGKDGTTDTIRVSGNKRAFSKWLKAKAGLNNTDVVTLHNGNGTTYVVLNDNGLLPGSIAAPAHANP